LDDETLLFRALIIDEICKLFNLRRNIYDPIITKLNQSLPASLVGILEEFDNNIEE
jgi:hypothetical protein